MTRGSASEVCPIKSGRVRPWTRGVRREVRPMECGRSPSDLLRVIRGRSNGSGETRATALPKPSAALFAQVLLATNCTPARASLRDSLSLGGYALGFPPWAGVSPSPCAAHLHPCSHRPWRLTSFGGYAPSAFVVEFELWLSSGWVGSHRVAYSRLESGGQADYDKYAADLPRSLGSG